MFNYVIDYGVNLNAGLMMVYSSSPVNVNARLRYGVRRTMRTKREYGYCQVGDGVNVNAGLIVRYEIGVRNTS